MEDKNLLHIDEKVKWYVLVLHFLPFLLAFDFLHLGDT